MSRLAHVQLARMLTVLERDGLHHGHGLPGQRDATVTTCTYMCAAGTERDAVHDLTSLYNS